MRAIRWNELRVAADVMAQVPGPAKELVRPQTLFNNALLDLLERWPAVGADLGSECDRLEALAVAPISPPRSHRLGLTGRAVSAAKRAAVPLLNVGLAPLLKAQHRQNLSRVRSLRRRQASTATFSVHRFDRLLDAALPQLLRIDSYEAAYREWVSRVEPTLPLPPAPAFRVSIVYAGSPSPSALAALLAQKGNFECIFTEGPVPKDSRFRLGRIESATSEFVLWVSAGSELAPHALAAFAECRDVDLAYADEDRVGRVDPYFKPSFCSELARERDLLGGAVWVRKTAAVGPGPVDWALALPPERIRRIPAVLSHRTGPYEFAERVKRPVPADVRVSIIVPFRDRPELLTQLLASVAQHPPGVEVEWLFVDNGSKVPPPPLPGRTLRADIPYNWSVLNNLAAREAKGSHLLFLNNDIEAASDGWLRVLMEYACLPGVGVVGANLWYPDGTLQHAGVALGVKGLVGHVFSRYRSGTTPFGTPHQTRQVAAVTGACLLTPRPLFEQLGGFDERLVVTGSDIEYCLRTQQRVLNVPHLRLIHHESLSRSGLAVPAEDYARERAAYAPHLPDRFYHPHLTRLSTCCAPNLDDVD